LELSLGFATLTSSTSHYSHSGDSISDNSGVYARNGWFAFYGSSPRPMAQAQRFYDDSANTEELRLVSNGHHAVDWMAGLFYTDQSYDLGQNSYLVGYIPYMDAINLYGLAPFSSNQDFLFRRNQDYKEWAAYGELTFNLSDNLHLTVGGRYFDNKVDVNAVVDVPIYSSPTNPPGKAAQNLSDNSYLLKANMAWDLGAHSMVYATFSQGYRHAGANAVPTSGKYAENPGYFTFKSDSVNNYELGFKGTTPKLAYSASVYYQDWHDPQLNTATSNWGFFAVINGQSAKTQGIELELSGKLTDNLDFNLGYTYADAKLTADVYQPAGNFYGNGVLYTDRIAADGERLPGSAKNVLSASLSHHVALSHGLNLTTVLSGYYQSNTLNSLGDNHCLTSYNAIGNCNDSPNPASANYAPTSVFSRAYAQIDSFQIWNLSATLSKDKWDGSLYAKNLFNDAGTTGVFPFLLGGSQPDPSQNYYGNNSRDYIAQPRTIGLVVRYRF
jgi:outer membrane receptor protein involved in Fe transport